MSTEPRVAEEEPAPPRKDESPEVEKPARRIILKRLREAGEVVAVVLRVGAAAVALYAAVKGIDLVS